VEVEMRLLSEDMRVRVLNALHWDLAVPRDRLNVDVENGWVTVSGIVDLPYQRTCAESDARSVPGVVGVTNLIRLAEARAAPSRPEETAQIQH
jgi:osmotically-inducible protein OsmY